MNSKTNKYKGNVWSITLLSVTDHISNLSTKLKKENWFFEKLNAILFQKLWLRLLNAILKPIILKYFHISFTVFFASNFPLL